MNLKFLKDKNNNFITIYNDNIRIYYYVIL